MNSAQIHELISELTAITEEERQKCLNGEEIELSRLCERLRSHFEEHLESLHLKENEEKRNCDLLSLQESIMDIENTLNSLSNELAEMRVMLKKGIEEPSRELLANIAANAERDPHKQSPFRRDVEDGIVKEVKEILRILETDGMEEAGNEIRRTQRTVDVVLKDRQKGMSQVDKVMASVN